MSAVHGLWLLRLHPGNAAMLHAPGWLIRFVVGDRGWHIRKFLSEAVAQVETGRPHTCATPHALVQSSSATANDEE